MTDDFGSRKAGKKGGRERAKRLTAEERSRIARQGALARWAAAGKEPPILAQYGAPDRPVKIAGVEIPAYVLADGTRVLTQRGLQHGVGFSRSGGKGGARRLASFMASLDAKGIDTKDLAARADSPIRFIPPHGGNPADGYEATILTDICHVIIEADRKGALLAQQKHIADRCAVLYRGFAGVGIIALVDEATGYQDARPRDALAKILEKFVAKELRPWLPTFKPDFYKEIFRLNKWEYSEGCGNPGVVGHWTNNIVYRRLAPGVLEELRKLTPRLPSGKLKYRLFQHLTDDFGHPRLRQHLEGVTMLMKYSPNWSVFMDRLDKEYPQYGKTPMLPFPDDYSAPPATGDDD